MFKSLAGAVGEMKIVNEINKRYPEDVKVFNSLVLNLGVKGGETMETATKMLSPDHLVQFRWREGKFLRPGVRYFTEVDLVNHRAAVYYFSIPISGGLAQLLQQFITPYMHPMVLEVITRLNRDSFMGHAATVGQTPPEMHFFNGQASMIYSFAAGIDYNNCRTIPANSDFITGIDEAAADGGARLGAAIYDLCHKDEKKRSVESALKAMPKSRVQKEMKDKDRQWLIKHLEDGAKIARVSSSAEGRFAWRLGLSGEAGIAPIAWITDYGHIVIETRAAGAIPPAHRMAAAALADTINAALLGRMSHAIVDLDNGQVAVRSGLRAKEGFNKLEPQVVANLITENATIAEAVLSAIQAVGRGEPVHTATARLGIALPAPSGSQQVVMGSQFLFKA